MTVCGRIDLGRTWPTATGGRLSAGSVPLLRAISRTFALIRPAAKPVGSQHSAHRAPHHRVACRRLPPSLARARAPARMEPEKIRANPLMFLDFASEMQQKAANTRGARRNSLRTGNFPRFNREFRSSEKQAHRRVCRDCNHRRDMSPAAAAGARSSTYSSWFVPVKVHRACDGASVLKFRFCPDTVEEVG